MTFEKLLSFASMRYQVKPSGVADIDIKARLIYRDADGSIIKEELADIGYCSGLKPIINVEMGTRKEI